MLHTHVLMLHTHVCSAGSNCTVKSFLLPRRLFYCPISLEVRHEMLHPHQRIWEVTISKALYGLLYPVQEFCCHLIILLLHAINLNQNAYDLYQNRTTCVMWINSMEIILVWKALLGSQYRGVGSNFALVGQEVKGVGPGGGSGRLPLSPPTPLTSMPGNGGSQLYNNILKFY